VKQLLDNLIRRGLCSLQEYEAILSVLEDTPGANMLVFGLGYDAPLWLAANTSGLTLFLENSPKWIRRCAVIPGVHRVQYNTGSWKQTIIHSNEKLHMTLPGPVEQTPWDIIFVDGPVGKSQGRMKSVYNAWRLANANEKPVTVFVHDYPRPCEKTYVDHFFGPENVEVIKRLAKIQV
jgi:hypothetical protein